jgi:hypothetical protein
MVLPNLGPELCFVNRVSIKEVFRGCNIKRVSVWICFLDAFDANRQLDLSFSWSEVSNKEQACAANGEHGKNNSDLKLIKWHGGRSERGKLLSSLGQTSNF